MTTLGHLNSLDQGLPDDMKLQLEHSYLVRDLSLGTGLAALQSKVNFLKKLINKKILTNEIMGLAKKIVESTTRRSQVWEKRII